MRAKITVFLGIVLAGSLLIWTLGADSGSKAAKQPERLINSIEGPTLYRAYCAVCHGSAGRGDGPLANGLKVVPSNLTRIAERNGGVFPAKRVERIIGGVEPIPSGHGTREMPLWGETFSQVERDVDFGNVRIDNLTRYLKGLQTAATPSAR